MGGPAPVHLLDGLPDAWVAQRDATGHITAIKQTVIAGFIRGGLFYTREQAAAAVHVAADASETQARHSTAAAPAH